MPPRSQFLTHTCSVAIGMILGSLATAVLRPAVPTIAKAAPKAEKPGTEVAPPAALAVAKPAPEVAPPAAPAVATAVPNAEAPKPPAFFPAPPPEVADLGAQADKKPAPEAAKPKPEDVLATKGLKRSGQVYILESEEDITKTREVLKRRYDTELGPIQRRLFELATEYKAQQGSLVALQQRRSTLEGLIAQADMNPNGIPQPKANAPLGQQPKANAPFGQQPVPDAPFDQQPVPDAPFGQQAGNNGLLGPNEGGMKPKGREQEPKKPTRAQLADELTETDENTFPILYKMGQLERENRDFRYKADRIVGALEGQELELNSKSDHLKKQYDELRKDPKVKTALQELNKNPGPRVFLGPVENQWVNLKMLHEDLLRGKGLVAAGKGRRNGGNGDAKGLEANLKASDKALHDASKKQSQERMETTSRQKRLAEAPKRKLDLEQRRARAVKPLEKQEADNRLKDAEEGIKKDEQKEKQAEETRKKWSQVVAVARKAFVEEVASIDKAVADPIVQRAANFKVLKQHLEAAKKRIKTEQIKLDPDKAILWVHVTLNENNQPTKMVLDPGMDVVQISEAFAAAQGIKPLDTDPRIDVTLGNGQTFSAMRTKLKAVQVGPFKVNDVECLVFSKGYDAPPLLGASFLDHFTFDLDAGEAKLTLTKVD